jgi:hypothetical protein
MAIVVAAATYVPNTIINLFGILPVKLKWIAVIFFVIDLTTIDKGNPGGHLAHIGGAVFGFIAIRQYMKGRSIFKWWDRMTNGIQAVFTRKPRAPKMRVEHRRAAPTSARPRSAEKPSRSVTASDEHYNGDKIEMQKKVDEILDKISRSGYESLSKAEKEFLFKFSDRNK